MKKQTEGFSIRLTPELKKWVVNRADENMRSMNAELNVLLETVRKKESRKSA